MSDVVAVMAKLDGDSAGMVQAFDRADAAATAMQQGVERGSGGAVSAVQDMDKKGGEGFSSFIKKAGGAVIAVAGIGKAIGAAFEQNDLAGTIQAQLGSTPAVAKKVGDAASAAYTAGFGESLEEVGNTATGLQRVLAATGTSGNLGELTKQATALGKTFDLDVNATLTATQSLLSSGVAKNAQEAFDIITKGAQSGANSAGDLADTLTEYPTQFRKLGIDGTTAIGLINQGLQNGARSSDLVADALKEFSIRAVDGSKTSAAGFQALGLDAAKMTEQIAKGGENASGGLQTVLDKLRSIKDPAAQAQAATALFGTQAEDLGQALYSLNPASAIKAMGDVSGSAEAMASNSQGAVEQLQSVYRTLMASLGKALQPIIPIILSLVTEMTPFISQLGAMLAPVIKALVPILSMLAKTIGPILGSAFKSLMPFIKAASSILASLMPVLTSLSGPILGLVKALEPVGTIIGQVLVTAAGALVGLLKALLPPIVAVATPLVAALQPALTAVMATMTALMPVIISIGTSLGDILGQAISALAPLLPVIVDAFLQLLTATLPIVPAILQLALALLPLVTAVTPLISALLPPLISLLMTLLQPILALVPVITGALVPALNLIIGVVTQVITWVATFIAALLGSQQSADKISKALGAVFTWLYNNAIRPAISGIQAVVGAVGSFISSRFQAMIAAARLVGDGFSAVFGAIGSVISSAFDGAVGVAKGAINGLIGLVNGAIGALNGLSISIPDWVPGVGGSKFGVSLPTIPMLAKGGTFLNGGLAVVGEKGPEVVSLPRGASVTPAYPSAQALSDMGSGRGKVTIENHWNVPEGLSAAEVAKWANSQQQHQLEAMGLDAA